MRSFPEIKGFLISNPRGHTETTLSLSLSAKMECSWPESLPSNSKRAIEELIQGRQFAQKLRSLFSNSPGDGFDGSVPAKDLVAKILSSFTNTLSILSSGDPNEVSPLRPNTHGVKPESSEESCRSISTLKDRRGCYKRR